jgi:hypothetical protein
MTGLRLVHRRLLTGALLTTALAALYACSFGENIAGGSSEVDNPVVVSLVDGNGARAKVTGSLGLYLADQSPALNPAPRLEIRLENVDSVLITSEVLKTAGLADSIRSFNLYLQGEDSTGSFLQNLVYNPVLKKFTRGDSVAVKSLNLTVAELIRTESVLKGGSDSIGLERILIPGSPFQAVVVDSVFIFDAIPPGVFPVHILTASGNELPLPEPMDTHEPRHHRINRDTTPVSRPEAPTSDFTVNAGEDRSVFAGAEVFLSSQITGLNPDDKRLSILWRQVTPSNPQGGIASLERATSFSTKVTFPRTGAYTFVFTAVFGNTQVTDTVVIGVQSVPENPVFIEPGANDTLFMFHNFKIVWQSTRLDTVNLEFSRDSGVTWATIPNPPIQSSPGFNDRFWQPVTPFVQPSPNCFFRIRKTTGDVLAVSPRFALTYEH